MYNQSYFLIPTGEKLTWKFDRPVIFLGEWCRRYEDRKIWEAMDATVNPSYGNDQKTKDQDAAVADEMFVKLFPKLCSSLNIYHGVTYSERFWRILLGSWFHHFMKVVINRVNTLQDCLKRYHISEIASYSELSAILASQNSHSAAFMYNNDKWNHELTLKILDIISEKEIVKIIVSEEKPKLPSVLGTRIQERSKFRLSKSILSIYGKLASKFTRDSEPLLISTFLSLKFEILLQVLLGQLPKINFGKVFKSDLNVDLALRLRLSNDSKSWGSNLLESIASQLLFQTIPICFLEAFNELEVNASQRAFPTSPKFIFTSNSFEYDEAFKFWAAKKSESGTKLIYGQHGNNYGTHRYMNPSNEEVTCDKFLTWGWKGNLKQHTPAFLLRNSGKQQPRIDPSGRLLLIEDDEPIRFETWDTSAQFLRYLEAQKEFVRLLDSKPRSELVVRLTAGSHEKGNSEVLQWKDFDREIDVDHGYVKIRTLIEKSRLVVHSYDSTGLLETLAWNLPTITFWQNGFENLRDEVISDYQVLYDVGILHFSASGAAQKVNEIWEDIEKWWSCKDIQAARTLYCNKYAHLSSAPLNEIRRLLIK